MPHLRGFARFLTRDLSQADDLVQETILRALAAQEQFIAGTSLKAWLFAIQRNLFFEQARRRKREREIIDDLGQNELADAEVSTSAERRERVSDINRLIWALPSILREPLILVGAQELSHEEAALICGVPVGTVKARVSRARSRLQKMLLEQEGGD